MTETQLIALRAATREEQLTIIRTMVFHDPPASVGAMIVALDLENAIDCWMHRELVTTILMLASSMVDANMRSCSLCMPDPARLAHCLQANLEAYYKEAGIIPTKRPARELINLN